VAALITYRGIPLLVTTGYDDPIHLACLEQHPLENKPFVLEDLRQALRSLGSGTSGGLNERCHPRICGCNLTAHKIWLSGNLT
jgi:hypothetical protein